MKTKNTPDDSTEPKKTRARDPLVAAREKRIRDEKQKVEDTIRAEYAVVAAKEKLNKAKAHAEAVIAGAEHALNVAEEAFNALLTPKDEVAA